LTENDSGATVSVHVGDEITVVLGSNGEQWDQPTAQGDAVRRTSASGGYPTSQPARASFVAAARGSARLQASTDAPCLHTQPRCMIAQRGWWVDVVVRG
jgi:hypothetical protein